ncbi:GroES-like protein [Pluteus cervinus]|uniref:GroES-like protein n=1 Tax=Pluteus cervinus TaxID=181527 RepID=A0ACD3ABG6_9AGAR|nr:GroES-like protein [Pluteus cervinus]
MSLRTLGLQVLVDLSPKLPNRTHRMQAYNLTSREVLYLSSFAEAVRQHVLNSNHASCRIQQTVWRYSQSNSKAKKVLQPDDLIAKVTTSCICGSDLYMYEGRMAAEPGIVFGAGKSVFATRFFADVVLVVGSRNWGYVVLKKGDHFVMPFNVACCRCLNCEDGRSTFCAHVNPGFAGGAYGCVALGPYPGEQAEYIRVPFADFNALLLPPGTEQEEDFALLADIFQTYWHGVQLSVTLCSGGPSRWN